ncbi:hypothetical protein LSAT2_029915 [Lamellibrachia satsuma]|nr:hypothetical protein LSAT2_029915 [Lamellibrachia satsuma]
MASIPTVAHGIHTNCRTWLAYHLSHMASIPIVAHGVHTNCIDRYNVSLVLFLVAVGLRGSYGASAMGENCTSSSDCDYDHGRCAKYDQCKMGLCVCDYGYVGSDRIEDSYLCQKLKKIGERCDIIKEKCYSGQCKGMCTCGRKEHASEDKKHCVGNLYGEPCDTKSFNNRLWKVNTCESSKGLRCDGYTSKCVCQSGMKRVGDHCEYYKMGETCTDYTTKKSERKTCEHHLTCNNDKKCACDSNRKEHTFKVRENGVETEKKRCIDVGAKVNVAESDECNAANICGDFHVCSTCFEWANKYRNNTKCLSGGADSQRPNAVASLGLALVAFFATLR